jgi:hypothetical protein
VCEERPLAVAAGDRVRLRAVGQTMAADGKRRRLANGTTVDVQSVNADGRLVLADGSTLQGRQAVAAYATTSHAAQGLTVDHVFIAGAASQEGLYVSATRGRMGIRIFVPDREEFLNAAGLRREARMSALEFAQLRDPLLPRGTPRWLQPLRLSLRYFALVRERLSRDPGPAESTSRHRSVRVQQTESVRIRL